MVMMVVVMVMMAVRRRVVNMAMCMAAILIFRFQFKGCVINTMLHQHLTDGVLDRVRIGI